MIPDWLPYLLNGLLLLAVASVIYYGIRLGITPMPSSRKAIATFIDLIPTRPTARSSTSAQAGEPSHTPSPSGSPTPR